MNAATPINSWLASLDDEEVVARIEEIDRVMGKLLEEKRMLRQALDLKEQWMRQRDSLDDDAPDLALPMKPIPEAHVDPHGPPPKGKVEAALRVMALHPAREWSARDVAEELIRKAWMTDTPSDHESLASTLSRLAKERRIHRPRRGIYQIAPTDDVAG